MGNQARKFKREIHEDLVPFREEYLSSLGDVCVYVTDGVGYTIGVSDVYENYTKVPVKNVLGHYMKQLEEEKVIDRSASLLVIKNRRPITIEQKILRTGKKIIVTSNPVFNQNGEIVLVASAIYPWYKQKMTNERTDNNLNAFSSVEGLIASSEEMQQVLIRAARASILDSNVLLTGETGVGKEVIAKVIHQLSPRKHKPFIKVNMASIPDELFESEMFGYRGGAFTGALKTGKAGLVQAAAGGTLFLDEISEIPLRLQAKLLRLLQEKELMSIGSVRSERVDVRFIAATNRNLIELVKKGQFREDLYYRLNVIPIYIPPLRERKDDIRFLAEYFLNNLRQRYRIKKYFTPAALEVLREYDWPGNVRELQNLIERLFALCLHQKITDKSVLEELNSKSFLEFKPFGRELTQGLKSAVDCYEKELINLSVRKHQGNLEKAAESLGIHKTTLLRKLRKYNLSLNSKSNL